MAASRRLVRQQGCCGGGGRLATAGQLQRHPALGSPRRARSLGVASRRERGAPNPGTSWEARSEMKEAQRDLKARGERRPNACGGRSRG
jgi:hypothetical protein